MYENLPDQESCKTQMYTFSRTRSTKVGLYTLIAPCPKVGNASAVSSSIEDEKRYYTP